MENSLNKASQTLEEAIKNGGINENKLYELSKNIDKILEQHYSANNNNLLSKYKNIIEREDKSKILKIITIDLLDLYKDISLLELELITNNIYDCCCLLGKKIPKHKILQYIAQKNELYYNNLIKEDKNKLHTKVAIEDLQPFIRKYIPLFG